MNSSIASSHHCGLFNSLTVKTCKPKKTEIQHSDVDVSVYNVRWMLVEASVLTTVTATAAGCGRGLTRRAILENVVLFDACCVYWEWLYLHK